MRTLLLFCLLLAGCVTKDEDYLPVGECVVTEKLAGVDYHQHWYSVVVRSPSGEHRTLSLSCDRWAKTSKGDTLLVVKHPNANYYKVK